MRFLKEYLGRNIVFYLLVLVLCLGMIDGERAFIARVNYLKSRAEVYLYKFESKQLPFQQDQLRLARYYYKNLLQQSPNEAMFYGARGYCDFYLKDYDQAVAAYSRAVELEPLIYTLPWDLGMIYFSLGQYEQAARYLGESLNAIPFTVAYYTRLASQQNEQDKVTYAPLMNQLLSQAKNDEESAAHFLAQSFFKLKKFDQVQDVALLGLKQIGAHARFFFDLGSCYFAKQEMKKGEYYLSQAIAMDPQYLSAYLYRREVRKRLGDTAGMAQDEQRAEALQRQGVMTTEACSLHTNIGLLFLKKQVK